MKNFNFPQENNDQRHDARHSHHSRRHTEPAPPIGDGEFTEPREGFPGHEGHGGRGGFGPRGGEGPRGDRANFAPRGAGPGFGPGGFGSGEGPRGQEREDGGPRGGGPGFGPRGGDPGFGRGGFGPRGGAGGGIRGGGPRSGGRGGFGPRGGGRVRKGNVRSAILSLLSQHSYNGYGMIGAIAAHTDGAWRPSPGSIYPALAALQSEGLIESTGDGKRTEFVLTEAGKSYVAENAAEMAQVWADVNEEAGAGTDLRLGLSKLVGAVEQITMAGSEDQVKAATEALDTARRAIYTLLAD